MTYQFSFCSYTYNTICFHSGNSKRKFNDIHRTDGDLWVSVWFTCVFYLVVEHSFLSFFRLELCIALKCWCWCGSFSFPFPIWLRFSWVWLIQPWFHYYCSHIFQSNKKTTFALFLLFVCTIFLSLSLLSEFLERPILYKPLSCCCSFVVIVVVVAVFFFFLFFRIDIN